MAGPDLYRKLEGGRVAHAQKHARVSECWLKVFSAICFNPRFFLSSSAQLNNPIPRASYYNGLKPIV